MILIVSPSVPHGVHGDEQMALELAGSADHRGVPLIRAACGLHYY
jgi:hypothetical protein